MPGNAIHFVPIWKTAPFIRLLLPLGVGIILSRFIQFSIGQLGIIMIVACILFGLGFWKAFRYPVVYGLSQALFWLSLGTMLYYLNRVEHRKGFIGKEYRENALVAATILTPAEDKPHSQKIEARVSQWDPIAKSWERLEGKVFLYLEKDSQPPGILPGTVLAFRKAMQPIANSGNPGGFDYAGFAADHGFFYRAFLKNHEYMVLKQGRISFWKEWPYQARDFLLSTLRSYVKGAQTIGLAEALLTGYRGKMDKELSLQYAGTGTAHIIAISGLHLGMIQVALFFIMAPLKRFKYGKNIRAGLVIIFLWAFTLVTGAGPSVLRSAIMFTILLFGEVIGRKGNPYNSLAASAFLLLLYNPNLLFDVGFQLSYSAVLSIFMFNKPIGRWLVTNNFFLHRLWGMISVTLSAQILTLPFVVYYFHQFPVYFLLANLVAIPLSGIALNLMLVLTLLVWWAHPVAVLLGKGVDICLSAMNHFIARVDKLPLSRIENIDLSLPQAILVMAIIGCGAGWLLLRKSQAAVIGLFGLAILVVYREIKWQQGKSQKLLMVYNVPGHWAMDIVEGHKSYFAACPDFFAGQADFQKNVAPARLHHQVNFSESLQISTLGFTQLKMAGLRLLVLDKDPDVSTPGTVDTDILLLAANVRAKPAKLLAAIRCQTIIFTGKMPFYRLAQWQFAADSLHLRLHSVTDSGAFVLNFTGPALRPE